MGTGVLGSHTGVGSRLMSGKGGRIRFQKELFPVLNLEGQIGIRQLKRAALFSFTSQTLLTRCGLLLIFESYTLLNVCDISTYTFNIEFSEPVHLGKETKRVFPCQCEVNS